MPTDRDAAFRPSLGCYIDIARIPFDNAEKIPLKLRCLGVDVDNTLSVPLHSPLVPEEFVTTLMELKRSGRIERIGLVSNMVVPGFWKREERLDKIAALVNADCVVRAYFQRIKPHPEPFERLLIATGASADEVIMIDDQLHTGILGANRLGIETIKVRPLGPDPFWIWPKRIDEQWIMRRLGLTYN